MKARQVYYNSSNKMVMRVDFPQGVPDGCTEWLTEHVGLGATALKGATVTFDDCAWFYERRFVPYDKRVDDKQVHDTAGDYIPTITVKDPKLATLFALRWSGR